MLPIFLNLMCSQLLPLSNILLLGIICLLEDHSSVDFFLLCSITCLPSWITPQLESENLVWRMWIEKALSMSADIKSGYRSHHWLFLLDATIWLPKYVQCTGRGYSGRAQVLHMVPVSVSRITSQTQETWQLFRSVIFSLFHMTMT